jgi:hypothetical protein
MKSKVLDILGQVEADEAAEIRTSSDDTDSSSGNKPEFLKQHGHHQPAVRSENVLKMDFEDCDDVLICSSSDDDDDHSNPKVDINLSTTIAACDWVSGRHYTSDDLFATEPSSNSVQVPSEVSLINEQQKARPTLKTVLSEEIKARIEYIRQKHHRGKVVWKNVVQHLASHLDLKQSETTVILQLFRGLAEHGLDENLKSLPATGKVLMELKRNELDDARSRYR